VAVHNVSTRNERFRRPPYSGQYLRHPVFSAAFLICRHLRPRRVRICFVVPSLAGGGAERAAVTVLSALDGARHERVLYLFRNDGVYFDQVAPGVQIVIAVKQSWLGRLFELSAFIRATKPHIMMPFLSYFIAALAVWLSRAGTRVVFNQQTPTTAFLEDADFRWRTPWRRRLFGTLTRVFYGGADAVVATSRGVADDLVQNYRVPRANVRVLHNPVDVEGIRLRAGDPIEEHVRPQGRVIAAAGRLAGVKNYPLLIDAVAELSKSHALEVWILGDGAERHRLEQHARARGVADLVRFLGFQQNPWRFIARADVFVLTSVYEGFGNVLIEAMACGTPVVATRSPGTSDIIQHEANGLLVDHEPRAVAEAIERVIADPVFRDQLVANARASLSSYAVDDVAARYDRLFLELVA
jgi:glycosyltransferase involved in cell wall biosynthesis